jgi:hypothetical protein
MVMNLEEEIANTLSKEISNEIDKEILFGMLSEMGWIRVILDRFTDNNHAVDITYWLENNCQGAYERNGRDFLFERSEDATMFILKWK